MLQTVEELKTELNEKVPVVVIGTGPVGVKFVEEFLQQNPDEKVIIYGAEPWKPYNRVQLSSFLSGQFNSLDDIDISGNLEHPNLITRYNLPVFSINRNKKTIIDAKGNVQEYSKLILAVGSKPFLPTIQGIEMTGVYTFRDMTDTMHLMARITRTRHTIVIGGGLLGLEAARAMSRLNTRITIIEYSRHLMFRQLDDNAAAILQQNLNELGITTLVNESVKEVIGDKKVTGVRLSNGEVLEADTIIVAAGIRPNIELAMKAGLAVGKGVQVNHKLQTSDPSVYAIGECTEFNGQVFGTVAPGYEQASVAARSVKNKPAEFYASESMTKLKLIDTPVNSMGDVAEREVPLKTVVYQSGNVYRKLFFEYKPMQGNCLSGFIAVGEWPSMLRLQKLLLKKSAIMPWQIWLFKRKGELWLSSEEQSVKYWPNDITVCNCMSVSKGTLVGAIEQGCKNLEQVSQKTGASTVCGSCKPLVSELLDSKEPLQPEQGHKLLSFGAILSFLLLALFLVMPNIPYSNTVQTDWHWDVLWRESIIKQITGYSLLTLGVFASIISLRKRISRIKLGMFPVWRWIHVMIGVTAIVLLISHTGLRWGHQMDFILMTTFVALLLVGALASTVIGQMHKVPLSEINTVTTVRKISLWTHILLLWPLPALLVFHILKVYWY